MEIMTLLKTVFPFSFGVKDVVDLVIKIAIYIIAGLLVGVVCWIIGFIPFIGSIIGWLVGTVANLYTTAGWIIALLVYFKVLK